MEANLLAQTYFNENTIAQMERLAQTFIKSGACPSYIQNAPQLVMVMQTGYEMGMKPIESLNSLYIVNGSINLWGKAVVRRLREHGWSIKYEMSNNRNGECKCTITKGDETYTDVYHFDAAANSGYTKDRSGKLKVGWRPGINRNLKLRYGAVSMIVKTYVPEVLGAASEIQEVFEDAYVEEVVEAEVVDDKGNTKILNEEKPSLEEYLAQKKAEKAKKEAKNDKKEPKTVKKEEKPEVAEVVEKEAK